MNYLSAIEDGDVQPESTTDTASTGKASTPKRKRQEHGKIYTMDDVLKSTSKEGDDNSRNGVASAKKPKKFGVWSEVANEDLDWGKCPLGKLVWE